MAGLFPAINPAQPDDRLTKAMSDFLTFIPDPEWRSFDIHYISMIIKRIINMAWLLLLCESIIDLLLTALDQANKFQL